MTSLNSARALPPTVPPTFTYWMARPAPTAKATAGTVRVPRWNSSASSSGDLVRPLWPFTLTPFLALPCFLLWGKIQGGVAGAA